MEKIRALIGMLLVGVFIGGATMFLYMQKLRNETEQHSNNIVDFVIAAWTGVDESDTVDESTDPQAAQFAAKKELPSARLGYFPDTVRSLALMVQHRYGVPAAVTLAQWALESGFGKNNLGVSNYFGHTFGATKKFSSLNRSVARTEKIGNKRTLQFTVYKNIAECFDAHGRYLSTSKYYRAAFYTSTAENFVRSLGVYAEDPFYTTKLITIIRRYKLEENI